MWWDEETDGELMYPDEAEEPDGRGVHPAPRCATRTRRPPAATVVRPGVPRQRHRAEPAQLKHTQFADFHGHGWVFRAVFKKDRKGNLLDHRGRGRRGRRPPTADGRDRDAGAAAGAAPRPATANASRPPPPNRDGVPVHLHGHPPGEGHALRRLPLRRRTCTATPSCYGEVRAAIEIQCIDCHGTVTQARDAADHRPGGVHVEQPGRPGPRPDAPCGRRSASAGSSSAAATSIFQNSMVEKDLTLGGRRRSTDTITPGQRALQREGAPGQDGPLRAPTARLVWGDVPRRRRGAVRPLRTRT